MPETTLPALSPSRRARLLLNGKIVPHPYVDLSTGGPVASIPATPLETALPALLECLWSGRSFCVTSGPALDADDDAGFIHTLTSGSTGSPKRIRRSQASWQKSFRVNRDQFGLTQDDRIAILGSLDHSLSLYALCEALWIGMTIDVLCGMRPDRQNAGMAEQGTTVLYATPTQLRVALTSPLVALRHVFIGGGHLDQATKQQVRDMAPNASVHEFYGSAETSFITMSGADCPDGSVGAPYPGVELRITDADEIGQGMVWAASPYLFEEYAEGTSAATRRDGKWLTVGEIGRIDHGYLFLTGRADRMFTVADRNYHPEPVEAALRTDDVTSCAILPLKDELRGNQPVAIYEGKIEPQEFLKRARDTVGSLAPRKAFRVSYWPTLAAGKPDLQALTALLENMT